MGYIADSTPAGKRGVEGRDEESFLQTVQLPNLVKSQKHTVKFRVLGFIVSEVGAGVDELVVFVDLSALFSHFSRTRTLEGIFLSLLLFSFLFAFNFQSGTRRGGNLTPFDDAAVDSQVKSIIFVELLFAMERLRFTLLLGRDSLVCVCLFDVDSSEHKSMIASSLLGVFCNVEVLEMFLSVFVPMLCCCKGVGVLFCGVSVSMPLSSEL